MHLEEISQNSVLEGVEPVAIITVSAVTTSQFDGSITKNAQPVELSTAVNEIQPITLQTTAGHSQQIFSGSTSFAIAQKKPQPCSFHGSVEISPSAAKMRLQNIAEEIINLLTKDPNAAIKITLEINAEFPDGVRDQTRRAVSENAGSLGFKVREWE